MEWDDLDAAHPGDQSRRALLPRVLVGPSALAGALFGGLDANSVARSDTWEWDGTNWTDRTLSGAPARGLSSVAYDTVRARAVFFGGYASGATSGTYELADTGAAWTMMTPLWQPPASYAAALAYDPVSGMTVMVGGYGPSSGPYATAYRYDGVTWTALSSNLGARSHGNMVFDASSSKLIYFGGYDLNNAPTAVTWEY